MFKFLARRLIERGNGIYCFNFHEVGDAFDARVNTKGIYTDLTRFIDFVIFLKKHFTIIDVATAVALNGGKLIQDRYAVLTFDDGSAFAKLAVEYCIAQEIHVSLFINSAYISGEKVDPFKVCNFIANSNHSSEVRRDAIRAASILRTTWNSDEYFATKSRIENLCSEFDIFLHHIYLSDEVLRSFRCRYVSFGLHGDEHDRFIHLSRQSQKDSLLRNIGYVSRLEGYVPVFAIPFGRPYDWNSDTVSVCNELGLDFMYANGGVNYGDVVGIRRIPSDNRRIKFETKFGFFQ